MRIGRNTMKRKLLIGGGIAIILVVLSAIAFSITTRSAEIKKTTALSAGLIYQNEINILEVVKPTQATKPSSNYKEQEETKIVYIKDSYVKNNKNYVVIDFIEWLGLADWRKVKEIEGFKGNEEECKDLFLLDDYYIYNEKSENIVMEVDKQAEIIRLPDSGEPKAFSGSFGKFSIHHPHEIIVKKGIIIKIEQRYIP